MTNSGDPCHWCMVIHPPTLLCHAAASVLNDLIAKGARHDRHPVEFDRPADGGYLDGYTLMTQFLVLAATIPVDNVTRPAIVLTGLGAEGQPLPEWIFAGNDSHLRAAVKLLDQVTEMAIRGAARARD